MTGDWGINNPALGQLNRQAATLAKRVSPARALSLPSRASENQVADTLAGGQLAQAGTPFVYAEQPQAAVAAALAEQIARLNQAGKMSAKRGAGLARRWQQAVFALALAGTAHRRRSRRRGGD